MKFLQGEDNKVTVDFEKDKIDFIVLPNCKNIGINELFGDKVKCVKNGIFHIKKGKITIDENPLEFLEKLIKLNERTVSLDAPIGETNMYTFVKD